MYDSREKAIRDQQWLLNASRREGFSEGKIEGEIEGEIKGEIKGRIEGEINMIRMLQEILGLPVSKVSDFDEKTLKELQSHTADLQDRLRNRRVF